MLYKTLLKKMIDKGNSLAKGKKPLVPLVVNLTTKGFIELQQDIVQNYPTLQVEDQLKDTDKLGVYTIKSPSAGVSAEVRTN